MRSTFTPERLLSKLGLGSALGIVLLLSACGLDKDAGAQKAVTTCSTSGAPTGTKADIAAFSSTLFQTITTPPLSCNTCHDVSGPNNPTFAQVSNPQDSFSNVVPLVTWSNLPGSQIVAYAGNGHCAQSDKCGNNSPAMLTALQAWATAEGSALTASANTSNCVAATKIGNYFVTPPMAYPPNLPVLSGTSNNFSTMTFPLDALGFAGATFSIQVQVYVASSATSVTQYRFKDPRVASSSPIRVSEIHLFVNGAEPPAFTSYYNVNQVVFEPSGPLLSPLYSVPVLAQQQVDTIQFGFKTLSASPMPACKNLALFSSTLNSNSAQGSFVGLCYTCHQTTKGAQNGYAFFPMDGDVGTLCARTLARSLTADPQNSAIVKNPYLGWDGHKMIGSGFDPTPYVTWLTTEQ